MAIFAREYPRLVERGAGEPATRFREEARSLAPRRRRRHDSVHSKVDDELAVVIADLVQGTLPVRVARDHAVPERKLHGLEQLGVAQLRDAVLAALERLLEQGDDLGLAHRAVMRGFRFHALRGVDEPLDNPADR